jgi:phosphatidylinositol-3-phosphatase
MSTNPRSWLFLLPMVPALAAGGLGCDAVPSSTQTETTTAALTSVAGDHDAPFDHIFYIMMENHATDEILGNDADAPYLNQLAKQAAVATNYFGVTHPSLPNYLAAFAGTTEGIFDDCAAGADVTCAPEEFVPDSGDATSAAALTPAETATASTTPHWFAGRNLVDQLEEHHLTWRAYMQSIPATGSTVEYAPVDLVAGVETPHKLYAQKHDPFMYFSDIRNDPKRMEKIVGFDGFADDLADDHVPNFVWVSPDQCHDMHGVSADDAAAVGIPDCASPASGLDHKVIALGDAFVKDTVGKIMHSRAWQRNSAIVIVWDEDDYAGFAGCCDSPVGAGGVVLGGANAPALVVTSRQPHSQSIGTPFNHYSLLGTIEKVWHLGCLGEACKMHGHELMTRLFDQDDGR